MKEQKNKLNVLLAITDQLRSSYKHTVGTYTKFFSKSQGAFRGEKRTYQAKDGTVDEPTKRGITLVQTTVNEKLDYFIEAAGPFVDALFSQEKTNAMNIARASLVVDGIDWGEYTSLELLRLKSLLESGDLGEINSVIENIPVRSDSDVWKITEDDDYSERNIYATTMITGVAKTTVKQHYVLQDPNLNGKDYPANYQPATATRDQILELGDYTQQRFSGEWSQREKAMAMQRRVKLLTAITTALKQANECEAQKSELTAKKIFGYLFYNQE